MYLYVWLALVNMSSGGRAVTQTRRGGPRLGGLALSKANKVRARRAYHRDFFSSRAANSGRMKDAAWTSGL